MSTKYKPFLILNIIARFVFGLLFIVSCSTIRPNAIKSGNRYYETFYVGDEGTQYFIKLLVFESNLKEYLELDFTFRYQNEIKDSAIINLSVYSYKIFRNVDSLRISNDEVSYVIKNMNLLFTDRNKNMFKSRFNGKLSLASLRNLFLQDNWEMYLYSNNINIHYSTPNSSRKKINKLNHAIFDTF